MLLDAFQGSMWRLIVPFISNSIATNIGSSQKFLFSFLESNFICYPVCKLDHNPAKISKLLVYEMIDYSTGRPLRRTLRMAWVKGLTFTEQTEQREMLCELILLSKKAELVPGRLKVNRNLSLFN